MIRISVSDLDGFKFWKDDENADKDALLARLSRTEPPTPAMAAGAAFAKLMEHAKPGELYAEVVDGWTFDFSQMSGDLAIAPVREVKAELPMMTPSGPVTLVGKVDGLIGRVVRDQKLTERWDAERYFDSLQWRAYLVLFDAKAFVYDVFQCKRDEDDRYVTVTEYHPVTFYGYPDIRKDVQRAVDELAAVIVEYFPQLQRAA